MANALEYRPYQQGDETQIVGLLISAFPKWGILKHPIDNWIWKYQKTPLKSNVLVCVSGQKIVGVIHEINLRIKIKESTYTCSYGDDVAVSADFRGRGIYDHLRIKAREVDINNGINLRYSATENKIVEDYCLKVGDKPLPFQLSHLIKISDVNRFSKAKDKESLLIKVGIGGAKALNKISNTLAHEPKPIDDVTIVTQEKFDDEINSFWDKASKDFDYIIEKNTDYLNWKIEKPDRKHVIRTAFRGEEMLGYIIQSITEQGDQKNGAIIDLMTKWGTGDVVNMLLKDASEYFEDQNTVSAYYAATSGHEYQRLAVKNGFIDASTQKHTKFFYNIYNPLIETNILQKIDPCRVQINYY